MVGLLVAPSVVGAFVGPDDGAEEGKLVVGTEEGAAEGPVEGKRVGFSEG